MMATSGVSLVPEVTEVVEDVEMADSSKMMRSLFLNLEIMKRVKGEEGDMEKEMADSSKMMRIPLLNL